MKKYTYQLLSIAFLVAIILLLATSYYKWTTEQLYWAWAIYLIKSTVEYFLNLSMQRDSQEFEATSASYISDRLFDKMSDFSDEYSRKIIEITKHIWSHWPDREALNYGHELADIRYKFCAWLPVETSKRLENWLEAELRKIWAWVMTLETLWVWPHRTKIVYENHDLILKIISNEWQQDDSIHYWDVIDFLHKTLGIKKMFKLRERVFSKFD
jgi:hypothetical protein